MTGLVTINLSVKFEWEISHSQRIIFSQQWPWMWCACLWLTPQLCDHFSPDQSSYFLCPVMTLELIICGKKVRKTWQVNLSWNQFVKLLFSSFLRHEPVWHTQNLLLQKSKKSLLAPDATHTPASFWPPRCHCRVGKLIYLIQWGWKRLGELKQKSNDW